MRNFIATQNDAEMRLFRFVQKVTVNTPDPILYRAFRNRRIKVNGKRQAPEYRLQVGDNIELYLNDSCFPAHSATVPSRHTGKLATSNNLAAPYVEYEDDAIAVLYKPSGILSHRDDNNAPGILDQFIAFQTRRGAYAPQQENTFAPALCNRLDRGTEGLLLAAKTAPALRTMNEAIRLGHVQKIYRCICVGIPPAGKHTAYLRRNRSTHSVIVSLTSAPETQQIQTGIQVLQQAGPFSYCQVELFTGRTHQIRAHLAFLGTPILGDAKYGTSNAKQLARQHLLPTPALCAYQLNFMAALSSFPCLASLAGKSITASQAKLPQFWATLAQ